MQAALLGVPIISPTWITACVESKSFVAPESAMYVRTLPTKTTGALSPNFGVASIAAQLFMADNYCVLPNTAVYLNGHFTQKKKDDIAPLLRAAGAIVLTDATTVLNKVKSLATDSDTENVVFLCGESGSKLSTALEKEVGQNKGRVRVVTADWLFDSISYGSLLGAGLYEPKDKKLQTLWELTKGN
jgi:hypothetical protein